MKRLAQALLALLVVLCLAAGGTFVWLRGSLPKLDGTVEVQGLDAPVRITRDRNAVPHIYADSTADVMFGLGFVHAQDRLWQMEMNRRIGAGRLSEILGAAGQGTDRFLRTLGVYRAAEQTYRELDTETRAVLESYAAGVNAHLETHEGPLPAEFLILRHRPEPWTPVDSLVWGKMMAWDLAVNWRNELLRLRLAKLEGMTPGQIAALFPSYPGDAPTALPDLSQLWRQAPTELVGTPPTAPRQMSNGSNSWALAGTRTTTGKPFLANDPHLGLGVPSIWYLAHLHSPELQAIGATLPGIPAIVLGRNDHIAWSFTNLTADVQDLFIERLATGDPNSYLTPGGAKPFKRRREVVRVRDGEDFVFYVRETDHGPVLSDSSRRIAGAVDGGHAVSLAWTALHPGDTTAKALLHMNRARNREEFAGALRLFKEPQQNVVYADVDGGIAYQAVGRIPVRKPANDLQGMMPAPGWDDTYAWAGYIPFDELPHALNPPDGEFATANHRIVDGSYPHHISREWASPYRIRRIEELLAAKERHSMTGMQRIQGDIKSLVAVDLLPVLLRAVQDDASNRSLLRLLTDWDGTMDRTRPEPLLFWSWYRELTRLVFEDDLGDMFGEFWDARPVLMDIVLRDHLSFCDDGRTADSETCDDMIPRAFEIAVDNLSGEYGADPASWRWGDVHVAYADHTPFTHQRFLAGFFDIALASGGDGYTVNVAKHRIADERTPFRQFHGASYRAVYDLSSLDDSVYIHSTGQSGNILSPHYADFAERWRDVAYIRMSTKPEDIGKGALGTLLIQPVR